ncbi:MAG: hypothetical protein LBM03_00435 [Erysipelotrichaceae bacterium]|jgi:hypothetical protein|nr:hypothetical protein [Erysipelotrichaceae bacterium]
MSKFSKLRKEEYKELLAMQSSDFNVDVMQHKMKKYKLLRNIFLPIGIPLLVAGFLLMLAPVAGFIIIFVKFVLVAITIGIILLADPSFLDESQMQDAANLVYLFIPGIILFVIGLTMTICGGVFSSKYHKYYGKLKEIHDKSEVQKVIAPMEVKVDPNDPSGRGTYY